MEEIQTSRKGLTGALLTLGGGVCWGLSGSVGQYLFSVEGMDSRWLVPIRLGLAGIIMLIWCCVRDRERTFALWKRKEDILRILVYGLLGISFCQFTYFLTIQLSSAAMGTIMQSVSPVFIMLAVCLQSRRRPTRAEVTAIILALAGVTLITTHGNFSQLAVPVSAVAAGIISAICVMIYNMTSGQLLRRYSVTIIQAWAFVMGSLFFLLLFRPWTYHYVPGPMGYAGIAVVVLVGNILAFTAYISGVGMIGPEKGILYGFSEPVTAALISAVFLHTGFNIWDLIGFLAVFIMLVLISKTQGGS